MLYTNMHNSDKTFFFRWYVQTNKEITGNNFELNIVFGFRFYGTSIKIGSASKKTNRPVLLNI